MTSKAIETGTDQSTSGAQEFPNPEIGPETVVGFMYDLYDGDGSRIESRRDGEPVLFLFGERSMLAVLQDAFLGKRPGDDFSITIPHSQAYGRRYPDRSQRVSKKKFNNGKTYQFRVAEVLSVEHEGVRRSASVTKVGKFHIDVDLNHPLAGIDLTFDVSVVSVRAANSEEVAHGHAHGPGGHQH